MGLAVRLHNIISYCVQNSKYYVAFLLSIIALTASVVTSSCDIDSTRVHPAREIPYQICGQVKAINDQR
jgi:hypothetical protein